MVLIIDNFDSFTYNLYHYFLILGEEVLVKGRDEITIDEIKMLDPEYIVLSPGPGSPQEAMLPLEVIDCFKGKKPILGVCLGHQCIGHYFGGNIIKGKNPVHGKVHEIRHKNIGVFSELKNPLKVTRYHSLVISKDKLPEDLEITAETLEGEIMGVRHKKYLIEGVQFHPEAILTEHGIDMLRNFLRSGKNV
ncbi:Aminodeoxychorismate/anthranilate synthase component 2 [Caloramator mitchellensis]|uniref:Aminodeoxychorismate/anthranilate synthase component 2 n=1 Tax=Caloramator mitchellensis TaxID=908809 RepID=A0A0R3JWI3_CALMK|nr:aminodeoxychorismate/anthranilate synthase component II [Caloramator mitchellensis]KRQ87913.1 Aminodeoxychorismate/anthranilate synthase component 2 [Caloramator mitchellensis]